MHLIITILLILAFFSHTIFSKLNTSVIPITKDPQTSLHKVAIGFKLRQWDGEPYLLLDLDAPFTWKDCIIRHSDIPCGLEEGCRFPLPCTNTLCKEAKTYVNPICPSLNITDKYGCGICTVTPINFLSNTCKISQLTTDLINLYLTNGRNTAPSPNQPFGSQFVVSCAPKNILKGFPEDVRGVAAFSWSGLGFPRQLSFLDVSAKFGLCLPSGADGLGVGFLGDGPFYFSKRPSFDLRSALSYTPMVRKSARSLGFYFKIKQILVGNNNILKSGNDVKLSTRVPYSVLRSDVYQSLVAGFLKASESVTRVNAVKPFGLCFKDGAGTVGSGFPKIDLETESGKVWTIAGANLMKRVGNGVTCLAFVDGGSKVQDTIVLGTYQMENNFLYFDLVNQKLGFSSSLLSRGLSCSGFNFTEITS